MAGPRAESDGSNRGGGEWTISEERLGISLDLPLFTLGWRAACVSVCCRENVLCLGPVSVDRRAFKALCGGVSLSGRSCVRCGRVAVAVARRNRVTPKSYVSCMRARTHRLLRLQSVRVGVGGVEAFVRLYRGLCLSN